MGKLTREDLRSLREDKQAGPSVVHIVVGMGTCGIAAGSKETLSAFQEEIESQNAKDIVVTETGCMGMCHSEPTVEIRGGEMPEIVYGDVSPEIARKIVRKHVLGGNLINDHILDKRSLDIIEGKGDTHGV